VQGKNALPTQELRAKAPSMPNFNDLWRAKRQSEWLT